jgi:ankyrin repeat protein
MPFGRISAPLLDIAIKHGQFNELHFLLRNGADPNQPDWEGKTPLMWAIGQCDAPHGTRVQILKTLLHANADPNKSSTGYRYTPLLKAAESGDYEIVGVLLAAGADVKATNSIGFSALHLVPNAEIARVLIEAGADPTIRTTEGETPVDTAGRLGHFDALQVLTNASIKNNLSLPRNAN